MAAVAPPQFPYPYFEPMRAAMQLRARLLPYTYGAALAAWLRPGRPFIRPVWAGEGGVPAGYEGVP